jgi:outer membrane immunogenic protein
LQAGWNYQVGPVVVGIEVNSSETDVNGTRTDNLSATGTIPVIPLVQTETDTRTWGNRTNWLGTATARIGYALDRWLVYAKGGIAASHNRYSFLDIDRSTSSSPGFAPIVVQDTTTATGRDRRSGGTAGVGVEWAFWNNWSAMVEYNYLDFGTEPVVMTGTRDRTITAPFTGSTRSVSFTTPIEQKLHTLRFGINYRFWTSN